MDRHHVPRAIATLVLALGTSQAHADAGLTLTPSGSTCTVTSGTAAMPVYSSFACTPGSEAPVTLSNVYGTSPSSPINIARIVLTYEFSYSDDGLQLTTPTSLDVGTPTANDQLPRWDPNYLRVRTPQTVSFESATVALDLEGSGANPYYSVSMSVIGADPGAITFQNGVLMFGLNDHPDDFTGTLAISIGAPAFVATLSGVTVGASVASVSGVSAVPEPSTYLLMAIGLLGMAFTRRR